ncbi:ubiquitin-protein ligase E3C-like [Xenia sp. Carnegie-2017]|uniref:ubiquitin-protein ligase E3C-like n=1 Tax=Xenia sp. Carnegie-2017 TaxID=2897299 RepID=UPI001F03943A|nr:ubiquitin-protein ligase E3C-like [Xenia sp. Carnegie-2017]
MFAGEYKSKPKVSLRGASKTENITALIHKKQIEREKREDGKKRRISALKIQAQLRGYWVRQQQYDAQRIAFDEICSQLNENVSPNNKTIHLLLTYFIFFYSDKKDSERLIWICHVLLKNHDKLCVQNHERWTFHMKKLLCHCSRKLMESVSKSRPFAIPLRMLEVFSSPDNIDRISGYHSNYFATTVTSYLVKNGYFNHIRYVLENRVPSSLQHGLSTHLADSLVCLLQISLQNINSLATEEKRLAILCSFVEAFLVPKLSPQVKCYILPQIQTLHNFPFIDFVKCVKIVQCQFSTYILFSFLMIVQSHMDVLKGPQAMTLYLKTLNEMLNKLPKKIEKVEIESDIEDSDEELPTINNTLENDSDEEEIIEQCLHLLNDENHVKLIISALDLSQNEDCIRLISLIGIFLIFHQKCHIHESRLLLTLSCNYGFYKRLWKMIQTVSIQSSVGKEICLLKILIQGSNLRNWEAECIAPLLAMFSFLLANLLFSLHDMDFVAKDLGTKIPFTLEELSLIGKTLCEVTLGVVEIMNHDLRTTTVPNYNIRDTQNIDETRWENAMYSPKKWYNVLKEMTHVIKQLHSRDTRLHYCPPNHWLSSKIDVQADLVNLDMFFEDKDNNKPIDLLQGIPGVKFVQVAILDHIPFVVPFIDRVKLFHRILKEDKHRHVSNIQNPLIDHSNDIRIRRTFVYRDAFDELSGDRDFRQRIHVTFVNNHGLQEAGVDGGGVFREFLNETLTAGFDQNIGFFSSTKDELLYPNPQAYRLDENASKHYNFLGRMLGKALYENMLVELRFAEFFLCKILSQCESDVDIVHLESLDPEMYRNLLYLREYENVESLELDFTTVISYLGESQVVELKPGGRHSHVTNQNRIEYIHLMADYYLNKQIRHHCKSFREGLSSVIDISWLRMFDSNELQILISGAQVPIDIQDLKAHTFYAGGLSAEHESVRHFWSAVLSFKEEQRRQLLKFVTSCSRPPLLGFKELHPPFTIHAAGKDDRLPTASTCVNLLKLPEYRSENTMREKLLYALQSGAGFELS